MKINISIGELVDKVTILEIKLQKFKSKEKLLNVIKEYDILKNSMITIGINTNSKEFYHLKKINLSLWDIEDKIRIKEFKKEFDADFIDLARKVYFQNDVRAASKKEINIKFNSELIEEKEYVKYK